MSDKSEPGTGTTVFLALLGGVVLGVYLLKGVAMAFGITHRVGTKDSVCVVVADDGLRFHRACAAGDDVLVWLQKREGYAR